MKKFFAKGIDFFFFKIKVPFWVSINYFLFNIQDISYSEFPTVTGIIMAKNRGYIRMGRGCTINSLRKQNPVGNSSRTAIFCSPQGRIEIGDNVSMSCVMIFSQERITIENNVMLGGGVQIWDTDFHPLDFHERMAHDISKIMTRRVLLKNGCFIGANTIIMKGVTIGKRSIIAAGSIVTGIVPDKQIWGGNPAKFIRNIYD